MKKITTAFLLITLSITTFAQQKKIDSLKKLVTAAKDDTTRVIATFQLGAAYTRNKPDSAVILAQQAIQLAKDAHYLMGELKALTLLGNAFSGTGNYPKALTNYLSALKISESMDNRMQS